VAWTSETVVSKLYEAVDTAGHLDEQRLEQWLEVLRRQPGDEAFDALMEVFCNADRPASRYLDQEYAGRLLLALKPPSPSNVQAVIKRILPTWNLSIEELPWYFEEVIGRDALLAALDALDTQVCSEQERKAIETFRFWIRARSGG
jgi:hypothetical protein